MLIEVLKFVFHYLGGWFLQPSALEWACGSLFALRLGCRLYLLSSSYRRISLAVSREGPGASWASSWDWGPRERDWVWLDLNSPVLGLMPAWHRQSECSVNIGWLQVTLCKMKARGGCGLLSEVSWLTEPSFTFSLSVYLRLFCGLRGPGNGDLESQI